MDFPHEQTFLLGVRRVSRSELAGNEQCIIIVDDGISNLPLEPSLIF